MKKARKRNRFYVYALLDPRKPGKYKYGEYEFDYEPFYVGKGSGGCYKSHSMECCLKANTPKTALIKKIKRLGLKAMFIKVEEQMYENLAFDLEVKLVALIGRKVKNEGPLCNSVPGGKLSCFDSPTVSTKLSILRKGRKLSVETRKKISMTKRGQAFSMTHRKMLRKAWDKRRKLGVSVETREKMRMSSKGKINIGKFKLISPSGEVFITNNGLSVFCEEHALTRANVHKVISGKRKHHKGWTAHRIIVS